MSKRWIKIDVKITEHWIFQSAEYFKWWFDLLALAAWNNHKVMHDSHLFTLERGQLIASVSFLSDRWGKNRKTIMRFLNLLQKEDMIRRTVRNRQTAIITICNYERYQKTDNTLGDALGDTIRDTIGDTIGDTNSRIYRIISSSGACAREGEAEKGKILNSSEKGEKQQQGILSQQEQNKILEELKSNDNFRETFCMNLHAKKEEFDEAFCECASEIRAKQTSHRNEADLRRHVYDWLRINILKRHKETNGSKNYITDAGAKAKRNKEVREYVLNGFAFEK